MRFAALLLLPLALTAADTGRIYVYSQRSAPVRSWIPVSAAGSVIAELKEGTFFAVDLAPGRYSFLAGGGVPAFVDLRAGEQAFLRLDWHQQLERAPIPSMGIVPPALARKEMVNLSYIPASRARSISVLKADPRPPEDPQLKRRAHQ